MFIELHLLQNFAPSCLNRDDTNSPKDCEFGGYRRARISSQCIKRSIRRCFREHGLLPDDNLAQRSQRLVEEVCRRIAKAPDRDGQAVRHRAIAALAAVKFKTEEDGKTQYLLFLGEQEIQRLCGLIMENWDALGKVAESNGKEQPKGNKKTAREEKAAAREAVGADLAKAVEAIFDGGKAADLALFGRMLADRAKLNVDAACQVAHAISTNKVSMEMDFFTAVDDLKEQAEDEHAGAGMLSTVEFNSSCFYRYANLDLCQLKSNLQGDEELARKTVEAFLRASIDAIPTGKQNSMAAHNPPSLIFAVVRDRNLWSLANAFVTPVRPDRDGDLVQNSIRALDRHWSKLAKVYGTDSVKSASVCMTEDMESVKLTALNSYAIDEGKQLNAQQLIDRTLGAITFADRKEVA